MLRGINPVIPPKNTCDLPKIKPYNPQRFGYRGFAFAREKLFAPTAALAGARQTCDPFALERSYFEPNEFKLLVAPTHTIIEDTADVARLILPLDKMDGRNDVVRATIAL